MKHLFQTKLTTLLDMFASVGENYLLLPAEDTNVIFFLVCNNSRRPSSVIGTADSLPEVVQPDLGIQLCNKHSHKGHELLTHMISSPSRM